MERPCKNCHKLFSEHLKKDEPESVGSSLVHGANWCFSSYTEQGYYWKYEPCGNLEYLEYLYEKTM